MIYIYVQSDNSDAQEGKAISDAPMAHIVMLLL